MTRQHARRAPKPAPLPAPPDHSWAARGTALRQERPAQWAMLGAMAAMMTALAGWVAVLIPAGGNIRFNPIFWLLALPLMVWIWGLQSPSAWAVKTVWLALLLAPSLALAALFTAPALHPVSILDDGAPVLATPTAMLVILALSTAFAAAGAVALRRSSLPGGTRPATYLPPGTLPAGIRPLPPSASVMLMQGSLPFSGALINGMFFAIVASLDPLGPAGTIWPGALQAAVVLMVGVLVFRGGYRLARRQAHAARDLRRGWLIGMIWAAAAIPALWAWPTLLSAKLAFSAFTVPMALAALWCGRRALQALPDVLVAMDADLTSKHAA